MNRVYIKTYGCQMNERDSSAVAAMLRGRGYSIVGHEDDADIMLMNTCSVRDQAEQKAIGKAGHVISKQKKRKPHFVLGVMGCMAQNRGSELLDRLPDLDLIVGTQKFHQIPDHLDNIIASQKGQGPQPSTIVDLAEESDSQNTIRSHQEDKQVTAFVSIMQGCNMNCSYCIVPKTRGRERGRPMEHILEEVAELADQGTKEITLLGQIVTSYGNREIPFKNGTSPFVQLLQKINDMPGIERIRFTSPHPRGFRQDLIEAYRDLPKLCEYIHLPMQSGSDSILKAMKRPYSAARFQKIVDDLRSMVPDMYFSTDVIVGFPGESDEDFEHTRCMFERIAFDMAFIFKYSVRSGTAAEEFSDSIPQHVKEERNQILLDILEKSSLKRNQSLIGRTEQLLVEKPARRGEGKYMGRTRGFRKTIFDGSERLVGQLVDVTITDATVSTLHGELQLQGLKPSPTLAVLSDA